MRTRLAILLLAFAASATAADAPFTWQLKTGKTTHYFVGSVHLLPAQAQPLPAALTRAVDASQVLVLESDIAGMQDAATQAALLPQAQLEGGIRSEISASQYERLQKQLTRLSLPPMLCDKFRAWFCSMSLELMSFMQEGFRPELGIDQQLYQRAANAGKSVRWFEPVDEHFGLFTSMTPSMSAEFLAATLDDLDGGEGSPDQLLQLWQGNDMSALAKMLAKMKSQHAQAYERLLAGRNRRWLPQLTEMLRGEQPVLVAVGAAHYAGPDGLVALLKARGLQLQPVAQ